MSWGMILSYLAIIKPDYIYAYPSTTISLCQFFENSNMTLPGSIKTILIGSKNIYDKQDEYIEKIVKTSI